MTVATEMVRKVKHYRVRFLNPETGRPSRAYFKTSTEAYDFADRLQNQNRDVNGYWEALGEAAKNMLVQAHREAEKRGVDLLKCVVNAVPAPESPGLLQVIGELAAAKRKAGRDARYVDELEGLLTSFAKDQERLPIAAVDFVMVEKFLDAAKIESRSTYRARLSTLFNFAVRREYMAGNPCARVEHVNYLKPSPRIFTPAELVKAWQWLEIHPERRAWFVLTTFCGLRPEEAMLTRKADVNFKEGWVRVEAQTSKVRHRRVVYPLPQAMARLKRAGKIAPCTRASKAKWLKKFAAFMGWKTWPQDITRHTAASMWLAVEPDVKLVAQQLANSPAVLLKDYKALVTKVQAERFWAG